jgi:hypothetical protein
LYADRKTDTAIDLEEDDVVVDALRQMLNQTSGDWSGESGASQRGTCCSV